MRWLGSLLLVLALATPPLLLPEVARLGADGLGALDHAGLLRATVQAAWRSLSLGALAVGLAAGVGCLCGLAFGLFGRSSAPPRPARTLPAFLLALLGIGLARIVWPAAASPDWAMPVLVAAIAASRVARFTRVVGDEMRAQRSSAHMAAARGLGRPGWRALLAHAVPASLAKAGALAQASVLLAARDEVVLSFLGFGLSAARPSLGVLIRMANQDIVSGRGWSLLLPAVVVAVPLALVSVLGSKSDAGELA